MHVKNPWVVDNVQPLFTSSVVVTFVHVMHSETTCPASNERINLRVHTLLHLAAKLRAKAPGELKTMGGRDLGSGDASWEPSSFSKTLASWRSTEVAISRRGWKDTRSKSSLYLCMSKNRFCKKCLFLPAILACPWQLHILRLGTIDCWSPIDRDHMYTWLFWEESDEEHRLHSYLSKLEWVMDWDCSTQAVQYFLVHGQIGPSDTKISPFADVQEDARRRWTSSSVNPCQTPLSLSSRAVTYQNRPDKMHHWLPGVVDPVRNSEHMTKVNSEIYSNTIPIHAVPDHKRTVRKEVRETTTLLASGLNRVALHILLTSCLRNQDVVVL